MCHIYIYVDRGKLPHNDGKAYLDKHVTLYTLSTVRYQSFFSLYLQIFRQHATDT